MGAPIGLIGDGQWEKVLYRRADDLWAHELRGWARKVGNGRASARAYAIANALNGLMRAAAARLVGSKKRFGRTSTRVAPLQRTIAI